VVPVVAFPDMEHPLALVPGLELEPGHRQQATVAKLQLAVLLLTFSFFTSCFTQ